MGRRCPRRAEKTGPPWIDTREERRSLRRRSVRRSPLSCIASMDLSMNPARLAHRSRHDYGSGPGGQHGPHGPHSPSQQFRALMHWASSWSSHRMAFRTAERPPMIPITSSEIRRIHSKVTIATRRFLGEKERRSCRMGFLLQSEPAPPSTRRRSVDGPDLSTNRAVAWRRAPSTSELPMKMTLKRATRECSVTLDACACLECETP